MAVNAILAVRLLFFGTSTVGQNTEFERVGDGYAVIQELSARGSKHCHIYDDSVSKRAGKPIHTNAQ